MTGEAAERAKVRRHAVSVVVPSRSCRVAKGLLFVGAWRTNVRGLRGFDGCLLCGEKVQVLSSGVPCVTGHRSGDDQTISQTQVRCLVAVSSWSCREEKRRRQHFDAYKHVDLLIHAKYVNLR